MTTVLYYGDRINITSLTLPVSGISGGCDPFYPSASTPILQSGIPDTFQILDPNGNIPTDSSGQALPVSYGDSVSIYNVSAQQFWKQVHGFCLMDSKSSEGVSNFIIDSDNDQAGAISISPYVQGALSGIPNSLTLTLNDPGEGKTGTDIVLKQLSSPNGLNRALLLMKFPGQQSASFNLWLAQGSSYGSAPVRGGVKRRRNFWGQWKVPILILIGVSVLYYMSVHSKKRR